MKYRPVSSGIPLKREKILAEEWLKSSPEFVGKCCFENLQVHKDSSTDEVIDEGLRLNQCLIDFYHQIAEIAPMDDISALFSSLEVMEIAEKKKLARTRGM